MPLPAPTPPQLPSEACDACGHSQQYGGGRIADAMFEIVTKIGSLFLCGHHFRRHEIPIRVAGHDVKEWAGRKAWEDEVLRPGN